MHANIDDFKTSKDLGCERRSGEASRDYRGANPSKTGSSCSAQWQSLSTPRGLSLALGALPSSAGLYSIVVAKEIS